MDTKGRYVCEMRMAYENDVQHSGGSVYGFEIDKRIDTV